MSKNVAIVVQRYGIDVVGGAETHARLLAEKLQQSLGWRITVLTTTAKDHLSWANEYRAGPDEVNGVQILRFPILMRRMPFFGLFSRLLLLLVRLFSSCKCTILAEWTEWIWIAMQGPLTPTLVRHLDKSSLQYEAVIFFTYLYYPTIAGSRAVKCKSLLVPTAHDEPPFYFAVTKKTVSSMDVILPNSHSEKQLLLSLGTQIPPCMIVGSGIDTNAFYPSDEKDDYVIYLGRVSRGKRVDDLVGWYEQAGLKTKLYLAGKKDDSVYIPDSPRIVYLGYVDETRKIELIRRSKCVINPSNLESLSLIVLEAAACGVPLLLNRDCQLFRDYARSIPTVRTYQGEKEFRNQLHEILGIDWSLPQHAAELDEGRKWVNSNYSWTRVLSSYESIV